ncbi:MAG: DUF899 family protein [bacterium]|nr:DUF899 family protein [bacterium]
MKESDMNKANEELAAAEKELVELRKKIVQLRKQASGEEVENFPLTDRNGQQVNLYDLFGNHDDLIVIHNMGKSCPYCTLWADGFNGVYQHLENRAGLALVSPDAPELLKEFAESRQWKFKVLSNNGGAFTKTMGYENDKGGATPGVSSFHREKDGKVTRVAHTWFGPGDEFCATWHLLELLKSGADNWQPKFSYE